MVTTPSAAQLRSRALKLLKGYAEKVGALETVYEATVERHRSLAIQLLEVLPLNAAGVVLPAIVSKTGDWQTSSYDEIRRVYQDALAPFLSEVEVTEKRFKREQRQLQTLTLQVSRIETSIRDVSGKIQVQRGVLRRLETSIITLQQELAKREQSFLSFLKGNGTLHEKIATSNLERQQLADALTALETSRVELEMDLNDSEWSEKISQLEEAVHLSSELCNKARDQVTDFELRAGTFSASSFDQQIETMEEHFKSAVRELASAVREFPFLAPKKSENQLISSWIVECERRRCEAINLLSCKLNADSAPEDLARQTKVVQSVMKVHARRLEREQEKKQRGRVAREAARAVKLRAERSAETRRQRAEVRRRAPTSHTVYTQSGQPDLNALREQFR